MKISKRIPMLLLRLLALSAAVSAAVIMVTAHDSSQLFSIKFETKFTDSPTFKYFVVINAIASGYTFILLFFHCTKKPFGHLILVLDLIMTLLLVSSLSACLAIAQIGKKGNAHAGWLPICGQVPKFCSHVTGAVAAGFVAAILYVLILVYSLYAVINAFGLGK